MIFFFFSHYSLNHLTDDEYSCMIRELFISILTYYYILEEPIYDFTIDLWIEYFIKFSQYFIVI